MDGLPGPSKPETGHVEATFRYPASLRWIFTLCLTFFLAMLVFTVALPWLEPPKPGQRVEVVQAMCGAVFGGMAVLSCWLLWRMRDQVVVTESGLATCRPGNARTTSLNWHQIDRIVDSTFHHRLELQGRDDAGHPVTLKLENQLEGFDRLRALVMKHTNWQLLCADDQSSSAEVVLPVTLPRPTAYFVFLGLGLVIFLAMAAISCWAGIWWAACVFVGFALISLADWYAITVDHDELTLNYPFRSRVIRAEDITQISVETTRQQAAAQSVVLLHLKTGRPVRLLGTQGGTLGLLRVLRQAMPKEKSCQFDLSRP